MKGATLVEISLITLQLLWFFPNLKAQEIDLSEWNVMDPWVSSCEAIDFSDGEEKLYTNIGSKAFTWLTGTKEQAEYEPVGELANYFGFAKLRNEIRDASDDPLADENLRGASWQVVLEHLDSDQRRIIYEAALQQERPFSSFLEERLALIAILYGLKDSEEINLADALVHVDSMGINEAKISIISAKAFGNVSVTLSNEQEDLFRNIRLGNLFVSELKGQGPYAEAVESEVREFSSFQEDLLKETASKFLSYETGSLEDAIFLPSGKIGNFFGFAQYRYEERATVNRSQAADLLFGVLTDEQARILKCLTKQVYNFEQGYIQARANFITDVYPLKSGNAIDENLACFNYVMGAVDEGKMGVVQAIYFDFLERSLSIEQIQDLKILRANTGDGTSSTFQPTVANVNLLSYPNPFSTQTTISYQLESSGITKIDIYDLQGQIVNSLLDDYQNSGKHRIQWVASNSAIGAYFIVLTTKNKTSVVIKRSSKLYKF